MASLSKWFITAYKVVLYFFEATLLTTHRIKLIKLTSYSNSKWCQLSQLTYSHNNISQFLSYLNVELLPQEKSPERLFAHCVQKKASCAVAPAQRLTK